MIDEERLLYAEWLPSSIPGRFSELDYQSDNQPDGSVEDSATGHSVITTTYSGFRFNSGITPVETTYFSHTSSFGEMPRYERINLGAFFDYPSDRFLGYNNFDFNKEYKFDWGTPAPEWGKQLKKTIKKTSGLPKL